MTSGGAWILMASFTPAVMGLISRVQADYGGNSVPRICPCSTWQRPSYVKRLMKFQVRSWNGNIFLSRHTIATSTKTTLSGLRWLWTQWQQDIVNCAELTGKKGANCRLGSSGAKAKPWCGWWKRWGRDG